MSEHDQENYFYGHIDELLDKGKDSISTEEVSKFGKFIESEHLDKTLDNYRYVLGRFQNIIGGYFLSESELLEIRGYVKQNSLENHSASHQDQFMISHEIKNRRRKRLRQLVIYGVLVFSLLAIGRNFLFINSVEFNPVEALSYETKVLEEKSEERLDLKTDNQLEVIEFFQNFPRLGWKDNLLKIPSDMWELNGASLLDYEVVKISMVAYTKQLPGVDIVETEREVVSDDGTETRIEVVRSKIPRKDTLVHYSFESEYNYLPEIQPAFHKGVEFYTFVSEEYNIIMWLDRNRYNLIFGRLTPVAMAEYIP